MGEFNLEEAMKNGGKCIVTKKGLNRWHEGRIICTDRVGLNGMGEIIVLYRTELDTHEIVLVFNLSKLNNHSWTLKNAPATQDIWVVGYNEDGVAGIQFDAFDSFIDYTDLVIHDSITEIYCKKITLTVGENLCVNHCE